MESLRGKVAVVAGASRGLGKGIAHELGAAGATVYVSGRTLDPIPDGSPGSLTETARIVSEAGGTGIAVRCDHTNDAETAALFERVRTEAGRLDILVNSVFQTSGTVPDARFWELPLSVWHDVVDVGTRTAYVNAVYAAPMLIEAEGGLIVNVSSGGAERYFFSVPYGAGKAALDKCTLDMAHELLDYDVAVVSLWPAVNRTESVDAVLASGDPEAIARLEATMGVGDLGDFSVLETPRYCGRAVVALAADPKVMERSGQRWWVGRLGKQYGFADEHGKTHVAMRW